MLHPRLHSLDQALALLPPDSPFRTALPAFAAGGRDARKEADKALRTVSRPWWEPAVPLPEPVALTVLRAVLDLPFAVPLDRWDRGTGNLVFALIGSASPEVLELVRDRYGGADPALHLDLLTLVASAATREGAETFATLVRENGWPRDTYGRLFTELERNLAFANILFPAILDADRAPEAALGDLLLGALASGLPAGRLAETSLARSLPARLVERLRAAADATDAGERQTIEQDLALAADLAGWIGQDVVPGLRGVLQAAPWPAAFAALALLRRGETVSDGEIGRLAANHHARVPLYEGLRARGEHERIPPEFRTRDAFAASEMVQWLAHPSELGRPPDRLERMAVLECDDASGAPVEIYVWRFQVEGEAWMAAVSGPYRRDAAEGPVHGTSTFSRFDPWDSNTAEGHAKSVLETLANWRTSQPNA